MKALYKILLIIGIIAALLAGVYFYFLSGKSNYQSVYLVPEDAIFIIETNAAFKAWEDIVHSDAWNSAGQIDYLAELNTQISSVDSLLRKKSILLKALSHRNVMVSMHEYAPGQYDFLYVLNLGRITRLRNPGNLLSSVLGNSYTITQRNYNDLILYELLDRESGEMYTFSFVHDKAIFSTNYLLVEASIDEMERMRLGRNLDFINVRKRIAGKGLFNVYLNYKQLSAYLNKTLEEVPENLSQLNTELNFSGFSFDISPDGLISIEGYTDINHDIPSWYSSIVQTGNGGLQSVEVIPARVASMAKLSFENAQEFYKSSLSRLSAEESEEYLDNVAKVEKKLKISIEENILSWIDDEIVLLQTQPSNLGRSNEFAAIIKARNSRAPAKNLEFIEEQIEKNSPVKIKKVNYDGYSISYISFPGILKALFGKMLDNIEKPYYTQIKDYIIFSNHPQTLKNIIDDYEAGNTLGNAETYSKFSQEFDRKNSAFSYFDIPVLYSNLKEFVDAKTWSNLEKNKEYICRFPQAGIQVKSKDDLLHLSVKAKYQETIPEFKFVQTNTDDFLGLFDLNTMPVEPIDEGTKWYEPEIIIHDLDKNSQEEFHNTGDIKYELGLKDGMKHGWYKEYDTTGILRVKGKYKDDMPDGEWKLFDDDGKQIEEKLFNDGIDITPNNEE